VFTGGSLLVGAVARTDLIAPDRTEELARALWWSLWAPKKRNPSNSHFMMSEASAADTELASAMPTKATQPARSRMTSTRCSPSQACGTASPAPSGTRATPPGTLAVRGGEAGEVFAGFCAKARDAERATARVRSLRRSGCTRGS